MAWALNVSGGGEYLRADAWQGLDESFTLILDLHELTNTASAFDTVLDLGRNTLGVNIQLLTTDELRIWVGNNNATIDVSSLIGLPIKIQIDSNISTLDVDIYINDVFSTSFVAAQATRYVSGRDLFLGVQYNITQPAAFKIKTLSLVSDSGIYDRFYDATASDHSGSTDQPILTDIVGSNDATGVGFPSFDASVWVNLGGGATIQESISFNSVSADTFNNNAIMNASITAGSISTVNNQTQITLNASIVATTSANFALSTNATLNGTLEVNSSPAVLMQNIVQAQANLLINSNAGFILSLGNAIQESLSFNSVADDSIDINVKFAGELIINSVAAVDMINTANMQGQLNIGSASAMSLVTSAIMSAGLDFSAISNVELTPGGIIVDITTPDSRTLKIAISDREYKIVATNRVFDVPNK